MRGSTGCRMMSSRASIDVEHAPSTLFDDFGVGHVRVVVVIFVLVLTPDTPAIELENRVSIVRPDAAGLTGTHGEGASDIQERCYDTLPVG